MLVTGGAGFIGPHLCARLVREGRKVISLDNYFTGSRDNHIKDEYMIGAREVHSLLELAQMFGLEIEFKPATRSTHSSGAGDTTKLEALGWKQQYTLPEYIERIKKSI